MSFETIPYIREYMQKDMLPVIGLFSELQDAEHEVEPNRRTGTESAGTYFEEVQRRITGSNGRLFVAGQENEIIGLIILLTEANDIIEFPGRHLYISDIIVKKAYRGKGIGRQLMLKAEEFAREQGITEIRVTALVHNTAALDLYHKAGFRDKEILLAKTIENNNLQPL
jgi:ribosomal protein S18 acetylase RimI-like enzyme